MAKKTQHRPHGALAGRLFGTFSGKSESGRNVGVLTQHRPHGALGGRRFGSFAGKGAGAVPTITGWSATDTSITLTYSGSASYYRIREYPAGSFGSATALGSSPATITGLTENTEYEVEISANASTWSDPEQVGTLNPGDGGDDIPTEQHESGGAGAAVAVSASGAGEAAEQGSGGAESVVAVSAAGGGSSSEDNEQHEIGGASSAVAVLAAGAGLALEIAVGGASSAVAVRAVGGGRNSEDGAFVMPDPERLVREPAELRFVLEPVELRFAAESIETRVASEPAEQRTVWS